MGRRKQIPVEEVERRILAVHGDTVRIVRETFTGVRFSATFVDKDHGEWVTYVGNVLQGHGHKLRLAEKTEKTCKERYGGTTPLGSPVVREKIEVTNLKKHGAKCVLAAGTLVRQERDRVFVEKYGVENPQQVSEFKAKTKATMLERHGAEYPLQVPEILKKSQDTHLQRHGAPNPMQVEEFKEKGRQTCLEKYGVENPAQDPEIHARSTKSSLQTVELVHWKTGKTLQCKASYERAFVEWCNEKKVDFDWQVRIVTPILTPKGRQSIYFIDAYVKDGEFADTWIELKGTFNRKNGEVGKAKWEWFHSTHPNSELWTKDVLIARGILSNKKTKRTA